MKIKFKRVIALTILASLTFASISAFAGKTYTEDEFISSMSGKSKKVLIAMIGKPFKTEISVKPTNADAMLVGKTDNQASKPVNTEMWYYKNIVRYDAKHTYKETELTIVNDHVMSVAFFNNH